MQLKEWLRRNNVPMHVFVRMIGAPKSSVYKYLYEDVIPRKDVMLRIYYVTCGAVSANDFYGLSNNIFEDKDFDPRLHANSFSD